MKLSSGRKTKRINGPNNYRELRETGLWPLSPVQTITAFQRYISHHCWVQHVVCVWPPCCHMLGVVDSYLKMDKFFLQHLWMLRDVLVIWPAIMLRLAWASALVRFSTRHMSQHVATGWPKVCNLLHPTMLRSVKFKCCDRLAGASRC